MEYPVFTSNDTELISVNDTTWGSQGKGQQQQHLLLKNMHNHSKQQQLLHPTIMQSVALMNSPVSPHPGLPPNPSGFYNHSASSQVPPLPAGSSSRSSMGLSDKQSAIDPMHPSSFSKLFPDTFDTMQIVVGDGTLASVIGSSSPHTNTISNMLRGTMSGMSKSGSAPDATFAATLLSPPTSALHDDINTTNNLNYFNIHGAADSIQNPASDSTLSSLMLTHPHHHTSPKSSMTLGTDLVFQQLADRYFDQTTGVHTTPKLHTLTQDHQYATQSPQMNYYDDQLYMHMLQDGDGSRSGVGMIGAGNDDSDILAQLQDDSAFLEGLGCVTGTAPSMDELQGLLDANIQTGIGGKNTHENLHLLITNPQSPQIQQASSHLYMNTASHFTGASSLTCSPSLQLPPRGVDSMISSTDERRSGKPLSILSMKPGLRQFPAIGSTTPISGRRARATRVSTIQSTEMQHNGNLASRVGSPVQFHSPYSRPEDYASPALQLPPGSPLTLVSGSMAPSTKAETSSTHSSRLKGGSILCPHPGCNKMFPTNLKLRSHVKSHKPRTFQCDGCHACFNRVHDLKRHQQSVHSVQRPFQCLRCCKTFSRLDALKRHTTRTTSPCYDAPIHMDMEHAAALEAAMAAMAGGSGAQFPIVGNNGVMNAMDAMNAIEAIGGIGELGMGSTNLWQNQSNSKWQL
ncbi:hypothetical protein BASA61_010593 [Batrachochytrium salamandrivorans]|nr:hypothetical protein BASA61_010593 [Batrachochytrium salamandrivorans]KAH9268190.1 hypothetical protein BASA84_000385 [Batrachochytrium salamandrivorans]KAJ1328727.1 hypothetical protein BSLG_009962 [Batrachochytrium salamandrivorans]